MSKLKVFIAEDDPWYAGVLKHHLSLNPDFEVVTFEDGKSFVDALSRKPDIVSIDYNLPDVRGDELLSKVKSKHPDLPVIVVSGQEDVGTAVKLLKEGAYDYIVKNDDTKDRIWKTISNLREHLDLKEEVQVLRKEVTQKYDFKNLIVGESPIMEKVYSLVELAASSDINVSITGETGTGKELIAKAIHYHSQRANKPFSPINVAAIPEGLAESELFGHEKGAFTGAINRRLGKFEEAGEGTLFLDEMGEMDGSLQAKLLRVLQENEFSRLGSNEVLKSRCRLIVATHKNLADEVSKGTFRQDLYYRVIGMPIELPPLRDRKADIPLITEHFLKLEDGPVKGITGPAIKKLAEYNYPGNVRELKAIIDLASVLAGEGKIEPDHIRFHNTGGNTVDQILNREVSLKEYNRLIIQHYLDKYDRNVLKVASMLDIGKSTIYRMLKEEEL